MTASDQAGTLYIVATPIGNLKDFTLRAIEVLKSVDLIAAEDTRHSRKLLSHYGINTSCVALHEHNERQIVADLLDKLSQGTRIALISDAGTPLLSDPGYYFVHQAQAKGLAVVPIPGPCAAVAALSAAGLASDRFCFEGFLPAKSGMRIQMLKARAQDAATLVYYVSPHRWQSTLKDMIEVFGPNRQVALARELTKIHETFHQDDLQGLLSWMTTHEAQQKGEMVLLVSGKQASEISGVDERTRQWLEILLKELSPSRASAVLSEMTGINKKPLYQQALEIQKSRDHGSLA